MAARVTDIGAARRRKKASNNAAISAEETAQIVAALEETPRINEVARRVNRSPAAVSKIAKENGIDVNIRATEKAVAARKDYVLGERLEVVNEALAKAREMVQAVEKPAEMWQMSTALKTLIEVRRLEEGEATSRTETSATGKERVIAKLDELEALRKRKAGA